MKYDINHKAATNNRNHKNMIDLAIGSSELWLWGRIVEATSSPKHHGQI